MDFSLFFIIIIIFEFRPWISACLSCTLLYFAAGGGDYGKASRALSSWILGFNSKPDPKSFKLSDLNEIVPTVQFSSIYSETSSRGPKKRSETATINARPCVVVVAVRPHYRSAVVDMCTYWLWRLRSFLDGWVGRGCDRHMRSLLSSSILRPGNLENVYIFCLNLYLDNSHVLHRSDQGKNKHIRG